MKKQLNKGADSEENIKVFEAFSTKLSTTLESICEPRKTLKISRAIGRLWSDLHNVALNEPPPIWFNLMSSLGIDCTCEENLLYQSVHQKYFGKIVLNFFKTKSCDVNRSCTTSTIDLEEVILTTDELNALQYVGGFVPHSLLKGFERNEEKYLFRRNGCSK